MRITLNGTGKNVEAGTVAELLRAEKAPERGVAVAINGQVVRRADHAARRLAEGDAIELIRAVQGG